MTGLILQKQENSAFRDRMGIIDGKGKRIVLFPHQPKGKYYFWRTIVAILLLGFFFSMPFITVGGHPLFLLNFLDRKFVVFGLVFWTQDFHIFALGFLSLLVFMVMFTAVFGRIFCGWICPQTIFLEMVFRRLEYWIEGDATKQKKLYYEAWNAGKLFKKIVKHVFYFFLSVIVCVWFSFWVAGADKMWDVFSQPFTENTGTYIAVGVFSGIFYFVFVWFRENACIFVCPYGRLQSVLLDKNTVVVAYDYNRGEPRGPVGKSRKSDTLGDCVDCRLCNLVCPTGIDIRNGIQLECVNCTACIDACNGVMTKIKRPKGLIRYASMDQIANRLPFKFSPRILLYTSVLILLISLVTYLILSRSDVEVTLLRAQGSLAQPMENGMIANVYTAKIVNKTFREILLHFSIGQEDGRIILPGRERITVPAQGITETSLVIQLKPSVPLKAQRKIKVLVMCDNEIIETITTHFMEMNLGQHKTKD
jgi:cytochrome c oxidase accessory protein FixG